MKKVIQQEVFMSENAERMFSEIHFSDTFSTTNHCNTIDEISDLIFSTYPKWISFLFALRNRLVSLVGLKTEISENIDKEAHKGFFKIYKKEQNEIILGADDAHLNFRASIVDTEQDEYNIKLTTLVFYNNRQGRFYMTLIGPFHRLVVKRMVKQAFCLC